jgi:hypothetical protein
MPRFKSILCPIDFSEFSVKAYDYAQSFAWYYNAELLVTMLCACGPHLKLREFENHF